MEDYKYEVVFVDEYNNWYLVGFFNDLKDAEPGLNSYLEQYMAMDDDGNELDKPYRFGDGEILEHLTEYSGTFGSQFDRILETSCGSVEIRGFVF